jgi:hypothetical protein
VLSKIVKKLKSKIKRGIKKMETSVETISINGVEYVKKGADENKPAEKMDGYNYVIVRTYSAGVFAGYLKERNGQEVLLLKSRRIWVWYGAASLSQLSIDGTCEPDKCQFPEAVDSIILLQAIEIIPCTEKARKSIQGVKIWKLQ